jgi:hypothetical protein
MFANEMLAFSQHAFAGIELFWPAFLLVLDPIEKCILQGDALRLIPNNLR